MRGDRPPVGGSLVGWRVARIAVWGGSMAVLGLLIVAPSVGLVVFWSVLIPVAPAILMVSPGLWRNICPLASTALLPRHLEFSRRIRIEEPWQGRLQLVGVVALLVMAPMGHVLLHRNGPATVAAFSSLAVVAFLGGYLFERKSGWCSTVCPVFPIEKLYGSEPLVSVVNAHCEPCQECVSLCPDATPGVDSLMAVQVAPRSTSE